MLILDFHVIRLGFQMLSSLWTWVTGPWRKDGPLRNSILSFLGVGPMTHEILLCQPMTSQSLYWRPWAGMEFMWEHDNAQVCLAKSPLYSSRVSLDMMSVQANTGPEWNEKNSTAFWRGRDSRRERLELVKMARANPTLLDAAFTNFFFFKHDESLYGPLVKHVSFFDFFKVREWWMDEWMGE